MYITINLDIFRIIYRWLEFRSLYTEALIWSKLIYIFQIKPAIEMRDAWDNHALGTISRNKPPKD